MRSPSALLAILALMILAASPAEAHAFLDHANPAVGGSVSSSPVMIKLWFTQDVEQIFSKARLTSQSGAPVETGPAKVDPADHSLLILPVPKVLPAGTYTVNWRVVSADTHETEGNFTFEVKP
jgi:methionine-rich copper-binding protein CopC